MRGEKTMRAKKHMNIMNPNQKSENNQSMEIVCRGCTMRNREKLWHNFVSSIADELNRSIDNSYLILEEEPNNEYDPNAIKVVVKGEFFGTVGYVGREFTGKVKKNLQDCKEYRLDMIDENEVGNKEIRLLMQWLK